ncbi:DNA/RNA non-specific endonuclease [Caulobacter sp. KR2-114]|uniref:DNA/RNA non-specific endonuclease n=1 Tax=Caulobacter sp. KR2-114 TaxID=3400912 RepID=UPI003BFAA6ED
MRRPISPVVVLLALIVVAAVLLVWLQLAQPPGPPKPALAAAAPIVTTGGACNGAVLPAPPKVLDPARAADAQTFCHAFYLVAYSPGLRDPLWSGERLTAAMARAGEGFRRPKQGFVLEHDLPRADQGANGDYARSGYDRGHMTPAADAPDPDAEADTFVMTNVVPQTRVLNEHLWERLETQVRQLALAQGEIFVVTGPIFGPAPERLGGRIAVPAATFKAVLIPRTRQAIVLIASNTEAPTCEAVSLVELKRRAGVDAFPGVAAAAGASGLEGACAAAMAA